MPLRALPPQGSVSASFTTSAKVLCSKGSKADGVWQGVIIPDVIPK